MNGKSARQAVDVRKVRQDVGLTQRVVAVRPRNVIRAESVSALLGALSRVARSDNPPRDCVSLKTAVKRFGGRLKPWGSIIACLVDGRLPFWLSHSEPAATSMLVRPEDIANFDRIFDDLHAPAFERALTTSQQDAAEILNTTPSLLASWEGQLGLQFQKIGLAYTVPMSEVLARARHTAWNAEIACHLGVQTRLVDEIVLESGVRRSVTGWCRDHLISERLLPTIYTPC